MRETLQQNLRSFGLTKNEILVYLYLIEEGSATPPQISKSTGIARTNCYHLLQSLQSQHLISEQKHGKRKAYVANDPDALLQSIERKHYEAKQIVPDLRALYTATKNKPKIEFYAGFNQVKQIYLQTLSAEIVYAIGSTKQITTIDSDFLDHYFNQLKQKGIFLKDILTIDSQTQTRTFKELMKGLYEVSYLPSRVTDQPTDILIWNNSIALITLEEPIFGTVITSPTLTKTFKTLFSLLFKNLK